MVVDKSLNSWKDELFEFLNARLDHIAEQSPMEKIEDITGPIFRNKSGISGQMVLGLIKRKHHRLLDQQYCNCPKCNKKIKAWTKMAKHTIEALGGRFDLYRPTFNPRIVVTVSIHWMRHWC